MEIVKRMIGFERYCFDKETSTYFLTYKHLEKKYLIKKTGYSKHLIPWPLFIEVNSQKQTVIYFNDNYHMEFLFNPLNKDIKDISSELYSELKLKYDKI